MAIYLMGRIAEYEETNKSPTERKTAFLLTGFYLSGNFACIIKFSYLYYRFFCRSDFNGIYSTLFYYSVLSQFL